MALEKSFAVAKSVEESRIDEAHHLTERESEYMILCETAHTHNFYQGSRID
jgi:hypothetical protein